MPRRSKAFGKPILYISTLILGVAIFGAVSASANQESRSKSKTLRQQGLEARSQKNYQLAAQRFKDGCMLGDGESCQGYAVEMDRINLLTRAMNYYRVACSKGVQRACNNAGWAAERRGRHGLAKMFYKDACRRGHPKACQRLTIVAKKAPEEDESPLASLTAPSDTPAPPTTATTGNPPGMAFSTPSSSPPPAQDTATAVTIRKLNAPLKGPVPSVAPVKNKDMNYWRQRVFKGH